MQHHSRISIKEAKLKAASFCAYRERTQQELRDKLYDLGLYSEQVEEVIADMITNNFLNEERFAKAYAGGKFRVNNWGKVKILHHLKFKGLSPYCIKEGLKEIDQEDYIEKIDSLILKRKKQDKIEDEYIWKRKIANYLIGKGFESEIVWERVNKVFEFNEFDH